MWSSGYMGLQKLSGTLNVIMHFCCISHGFHKVESQISQSPQSHLEQPDRICTDSSGENLWNGFKCETIWELHCKNEFLPQYLFSQYKYLNIQISTYPNFIYLFILFVMWFYFFYFFSVYTQMLHICSQMNDFEEMWSGLKQTDGISSPAVSLSYRLCQTSQHRSCHEYETPQWRLRRVLLILWFYKWLLSHAGSSGALWLINTSD